MCATLSAYLSQKSLINIEGYLYSSLNNLIQFGVYNKLMSTWKQVAAGKYAQSNQLNQMIKLRQQNTKMRIQMEGLKTQIAAKDNKIGNMTEQLQKLQKNDEKINEKLTDIASILDFELSSKKNSFDLVQEIIHKIKILRESKQQLNRTISEMSKSVGGSSERAKQFESKFHAMQKDLENKEIIIKRLQSDILKVSNQNKQLKNQNEKKGQIAAEYSHRLTSVEKQKSQLEIQLNILRQKNEGTETPHVKKQILDLLGKFNVRQDDTLRSYLKKNQLFKTGSSANLPKRNKYDFIFDN